MHDVVAAAVQAAPHPGPLDAAAVATNTGRALELVRDCVADTGAGLIVVPEAVTTGFAPGCSPEQLWDLVSAVPGPVTDEAAACAAALGVHLVWPTYERGGDRGVVYNSAVLLDPRGEVAGVYRKTHLYLPERREAGGWVTPGDDVTVVDTDLGRIGTMICFDGDYPELCRIQAVRGAEVIARPSAFLRSADIWELTTRARAYDNHVYVVAANAVGRDPGGNLYFGNSMIVGPTAGVLARATSQEGWVAARLDPDPLRVISPGSSVPQVFDHLADRNVALYQRHRDALESPARAAFPTAATPGDARP
jgi:deaminated glutathione amidase